MVTQLIPGRRQSYSRDNAISFFYLKAFNTHCEISALSCRMQSWRKIPPEAGAVSGSKLVKTNEGQKHAERRHFRTSNTIYHVGTQHPLGTCWYKNSLYISYRTINNSNRHHLSFQDSAKTLL